jgi:tetratricopeptide (TPR) repeat protein
MRFTFPFREPVQITKLIIYLLVAITLVGLHCPGFADQFKLSLEESTRAEPEKIDKLLKAGVAQFQAGETVEAERLFSEVVKIDAGNETAHFNLGVIAEQKMDLSSALQNYQAALKANPNDKELQAAVSQVATKLAANNNTLFSETPSSHLRLGRPVDLNNKDPIPSGIVINTGSGYRTIPHCPVCSMVLYNPNYIPQDDHCPGCYSAVSDQTAKSGLKHTMDRVFSTALHSY